MSMTHLQRLEAEAIHIFREVAATFTKPVMLYSVGKDSSVMQMRPLRVRRCPMGFGGEDC